MSSIEQPKSKNYNSFFSFFLTALFGASVNFFSQILYRKTFDYSTSVFLGYLTATVVSFVPTKLFAFSAKKTGNTGREMIKFGIIALVAWGVQVGVAVATLEWIANPYFPNASMFWREKMSHVVGMGFSFLANYFGHKLLTFRTTGVYDKIRARSARQEEKQF
ncbi:GtrA family protein [Spirosoma pollinicola]|uniref:GtrA family protein n=1 Tax=Spirosoma pollinicola TaxID=2057025 RepID=A0A2K8ZCE9_9BACT|nr:GtrA family protein [Spirosoma pollinicola]AUD07514.1 GtrA family protein [Spirosoma pollinicola]